MTKTLSFASWNVKHFSGKKEKVKKVVQLLNSKFPENPWINNYSDHALIYGEIVN